MIKIMKTSCARDDAAAWRSGARHAAMPCHGTRVIIRSSCDRSTRPTHNTHSFGIHGAHLRFGLLLLPYVSLVFWISIS